MNEQIGMHVIRRPKPSYGSMDCRRNIDYAPLRTWRIYEQTIGTRGYVAKKEIDGESMSGRGGCMDGMRAIYGSV